MRFVFFTIALVATWYGCDYLPNLDKATTVMLAGWLLWDIFGSVNGPVQWRTRKAKIEVAKCKVEDAKLDLIYERQALQRLKTADQEHKTKKAKIRLKTAKARLREIQG